MIKRLSVAQKFIFILFGLLLLFSVALSSVLINQANSDLKRYQSRVQAQYFKQYQLLNTFISDRMVRLIEGFAAGINSGDLVDLEVLESNLNEQQESLQLRWEVEEVWLLDLNDQHPPESSNQNSPYVFLKNYVSQQQRPVSRVVCAPECYQYLGVPILTSDNGLAVVGVRFTLSELLGSFAQSADTKVAKVNISSSSSVQQTTDLANKLMLHGSLTDFNRGTFEGLISRLPSEMSLADFYQFGFVLEQDNSAQLLNLLPISQQTSSENYLLTVTDISERYFALNNYHWLVIIAATLMSGSFIFLMTWLLRSYRRKLENLSQRLPLLAENQFEDFRDLGIGNSIWIEDELDQLESAAESLATNLEKLNNQAVEDKLQLEKMAMFDSLTGLPNRSMLMFQIDKYIAALKRTDGAIALMFLDLDDFKKINDTHGHGIGDALLKEVANRIAIDLRETDIAARFGGDEYAILITDVENRRDAEIVADKLLKRFDEGFRVREHTFFVNSSIGIAITDDSQVSAAELLRHADIAMYEAKNVSQSAFKVYDSAMNLKVMRRVELETEARSALMGDQFYLALQPKVALETGRLVGFESLIRWKHPQKGAISPGEFIPILEKTSLMVQVDYWVIARSMSLLAELSINGYSDISIAVNLSAAQFVDSNLVDYLRQQLRHHGIDPKRIELELTETALVEDLTRACDVMNEVRELGCLIAIDDFGTGYSSLSYLKNMPADVVKIDQSFVSGMLEDEGDRNIVHSTISMVRAMDIDVVAEGIESYSQYDLLKSFECHIGQGYFISRPIDESSLWQTLHSKCHQGIWNIQTGTR